MNSLNVFSLQEWWICTNSFCYGHFANYRTEISISETDGDTQVPTRCELGYWRNRHWRGKILTNQRAQKTLWNFSHTWQLLTESGRCRTSQTQNWTWVWSRLVMKKCSAVLTGQFLISWQTFLVLVWGGWGLFRMRNLWGLFLLLSILGPNQWFQFLGPISDMISKGGKTI